MKPTIFLVAVFCFLVINKNGFSQDENRFSVNGIWGYKVDEKIVIEPKYDTIHKFLSGIAIVEMNQKYGAINTTGQEIIPTNFTHFAHYGMQLIKVEQNGKWGLLSYTGEEVIPLMYDEIGWDTDNKYISVKLNEKWGMINLKNKTIIPFEYETNFYGNEGLFSVSKNGLYGFINLKKKTIIPFQYSDAFNFYGGLAEVYLDTLVGFIDKNNDVIVPIRYSSVYETDNELIIVSIGSKYGLWTRTGKELFKPVYSDILEQYEYGAILIDSNSFYITDSDGNVLLNEPCSNIEESDLYSEWVYFTRNGKRGIYDMEAHELLLDAKYDNFDEYEYDILIVINENKMGLFQISTRTMLVKPLYDEVEMISEELFIVKKDNLYGVIRSDKSFLVKIEYNSVWMESKRLIGVESGEKQLYFNLEGERVYLDEEE